jgi:glycosidase
MNQITNTVLDSYLNRATLEPVRRITGNAKYPSLYQINTRVWLTELSKSLGRPATFDDIPDSDLDGFAELGFYWVWFLSVWTTGEQGRKISLKNAEWRREFEQTLPDLKDNDIGGSGFAIAAYHAHPNLGGDEALQRLREKLNNRGLKLMLDFVPNHMAPDHPWLQEHREYFVSGTTEELERNPNNYTQLNLKGQDLILAYGRDPYFAGWPDTIQLDYSNPATVNAMTKELIRISDQCDGVRCDMAMLVLPEVFERTWGRKAQSFWPEATQAVREKHPDFCFMAEVYWDMEWKLQQLGFDYTYDKRLYDRLHEGFARPIREHLNAGLDYQNKLARFLENHDEPCAAKVFGPDKCRAAAVITFLSPGMRFFHQGQFEGKMKRISPHLIRAPYEPLNTELQDFYYDLLAVIKQPLFNNGQWRMLECVPAWEGNESWNSFIAFSWEEKNGRRAFVTVNYAPHSSQGYLRLPFPDIGNQTLELRDLMSVAMFHRDGNDLLSRGLYLDMPPFGYHVFELSVI